MGAWVGGGPIGWLGWVPAASLPGKLHPWPLNTAEEEEGVGGKSQNCPHMVVRGELGLRESSDFQAVKGGCLKCVSNE